MLTLTMASRRCGVVVAVAVAADSGQWTVDGGQGPVGAATEQYSPIARVRVTVGIPMPPMLAVNIPCRTGSGRHKLI